MNCRTFHNVRRIIGDNQNWACNAGEFAISLGAVLGEHSFAIPA